MAKDLLYEIGVEEIPASFVLPALEQLERALVEGLGKLRLTCGEVRTYGTPRRLAITIGEVADCQPDVEQELKGPPADRAFDADGKPTKAAEGFAQKCGIPVEGLEVRDEGKGQWVFARVHQTGEPAEAVIPELLVAATLGLTFPKTMRWADLDQRFARPIRWLVALLGDQVLDLEITGVRSGNVTRGHRFLGTPSVPVASAAAYREALRGDFVLADLDERREAIRVSAEAAAAQIGGKARIDEDLLSEVGFLVEWPTCLWGQFDARFMALPEPVIVTVMQGHQRYFPVEGPDGSLMPYFIAIRNGDDQGLETIREGNQKVIAPRLADAEFYLTEDLKHSLDSRVESLARVTFMEGMGTLADKTLRLESLVSHLAATLGTDGPATQAALRAAHLAKADLVTLMVGDSKLGELQGVIGGEYARRQGEGEDAAAAIAEQYKPRGASDTVPATPAGTLVALADKLDNLAACFRLGQIPSGSTDPFALRRQAQGIVEILVTGGLRLDLPAALTAAVGLLPEPRPEKKQDQERVLAPEAAVEALMAFFGQRVDYLLTNRGVTYDTARAVLGAPWTDVLEATERATFLQDLRTSQPDLFDTLVTSAERPARITRPENLPEDATADPALFTQEWEGRLWQLAEGTRSRVEAAFLAEPQDDAEYEPITLSELEWPVDEDGGARNAAIASASPDYAAAVAALSSLAEPIHEFFAAVMVMADDEAIKRNRLALLAGIDRMFLGIADLSQIVREGGAVV